MALLRIIQSAYPFFHLSSKPRAGSQSRALHFSICLDSRSASDPTLLTPNAIHDRRYRWALEMLEVDPKLAPFVNKALEFMHSFETRDSKNLEALDNLIVEGREITRKMEDVRKSQSRSDRTEEQLDEMVKVLQQMTMVDRMS